MMRKENMEEDLETKKRLAQDGRPPSRAAERFISLQRCFLTVSNDALALNVHTYCMLYVVALKISTWHHLH